MERLCNYIDGEFVEPASGLYLDNIDPATGQVYGQVPDSDERDVEHAVAAAERAFPGWSQTPAVDRSRMVLRLADLVESNLDRLARAECIDTGKPLSLAKTVDVPRAVASLRFFGSAILHTRSETHVTDGVALNYTLRQPRGVAGLISPWNLPLYLLAWKVAPAISFGDTAVAKPSEITPVTAFIFSELSREAGLPPGVLNIVHGRGPSAGGAIVRHPSVGTISFTGGTATGTEVAKVASPLFKKVALELGGKNPNIIFADADLDEVVAQSLRSSFANQGQICLCGSRIFVEQQAYEPFLDRFVKATQKLKVGDPLEDDTDLGAVVSQVQLDKILYYVQLAREEGGNVLCGGQRAANLPERCKDGYFVEPTIVTGLGVDCRVNQEEIFGPVVTVMPFSTEQEVIRLANATPYGLSASLWTRDIARAHRMAAMIQSGTVWVNCWMVRDLRVPFGGMKSSGVGREGGDEAMRFYTEPKNVCIRVPQGESA